MFPNRSLKLMYQIEYICIIPLDWAETSCWSSMKGINLVSVIVDHLLYLKLLLKTVQRVFIKMDCMVYISSIFESSNLRPIRYSCALFYLCSIYISNIKKLCFSRNGLWSSIERKSGRLDAYGRSTIQQNFGSQTKRCIQHIYCLFLFLFLYILLLQRISSTKAVYVETMIWIRQYSTLRKDGILTTHYVPYITN